MNDQRRDYQDAGPARPGLGQGPQTAAIATVATAYVMQADTEAGYLNIAQRLAKAGMLPKGYDSAEKAAIAMMAGREFGISALQSLSGFAVINGRAVPWGVTLRGIADRLITDEITGCLFGIAEMKHVAVEEDGPETGTGAELAAALRKALRRRLARLGWSYDAKAGRWIVTDEAEAKAPRPHYGCGYAAYKREGRTVRVELFDTADAHRAGLISKNEIWSKWTQRMLEAKAVTFAVRALAAGVLGGLTSTAEELEEGETRGAAPAPTPTSSALDDLTRAAKPTDPAVQDAEYSVRPDGGQPPPDPQPTEPPAPEASMPGPESFVGTARGLYGSDGSDALRTVIARIKKSGGNPNDFQEKACMAGIGEVKSPAKMSNAERMHVAIALAAFYDASKPAQASPEPEPTPEPPPQTPAEAEVDF